ncbi:putative Polycomb group protein ASXL3 [Heptranchias perlo]|uniref:putative Polycomb group protein ASXL3 n=1 Tax=Heptranchias perlo TaxID=212740 RepID=UPI003559992A
MKDKRKKKDRTWAEAARLVLEKHPNTPMTPKLILQAIQKEGLKEMSGTSPLACLNAMLHTNARVEDGAFCRIPGKMGLYALKKDELVMSAEGVIDLDGESDLDSCEMAETNNANGEESGVCPDPKHVPDGISSPHSTSSSTTVAQNKLISSTQQHTKKALKQALKQQQKRRIGVSMMMNKAIPCVVLTPLKVSEELPESPSGSESNNIGDLNGSDKELKDGPRSSPNLAKTTDQHLKRLKRSSSGQLKRTRGEEIDVETPGSILVNTNLRALINKHTFASLPHHFQQQLLILLPEVDRQVGCDGISRLSASALNNEFFAYAAQGWKERLAEGEFTPEMQLRIRQEIEKEKKIEQWKEKFFEQYYGEKLGITQEEAMKLESVKDSFENQDSCSFSAKHTISGPCQITSGCKRESKENLVPYTDLKQTQCIIQQIAAKEPSETAKEEDILISLCSDITSDESIIQEEIAEEVEPNIGGSHDENKPPESNTSDIDQSCLLSPEKAEQEMPADDSKPVLITQSIKEFESQSEHTIAPRTPSRGISSISFQLLTSTFTPSQLSDFFDASSSGICEPAPNMSNEESTLERCSALMCSESSSCCEGLEAVTNNHDSPEGNTQCTSQQPHTSICSETSVLSELSETENKDSENQPLPLTSTPSDSSTSTSEGVRNDNKDLELQKRKPLEQHVLEICHEKRPRIENEQSFQILPCRPQSEKEMPTKEKPKVPPIKIHLSRIKLPFVIKSQPSYQICPKASSSAVPGGGRNTGARTLADIKARAQQARAQREAAAAAAAAAAGAVGDGGISNTGSNGGQTRTLADIKAQTKAKLLAKHQARSQLLKCDEQPSCKQGRAAVGDVQDTSVSKSEETVKPDHILSTNTFIMCCTKSSPVLKVVDNVTVSDYTTNSITPCSPDNVAVANSAHSNTASSCVNNAAILHCADNIAMPNSVNFVTSTSADSIAVPSSIVEEQHPHNISKQNCANSTSIPSCADGSAIPSCADGSAIPSCADGSAIPSCADGSAIPSCADGSAIPSCADGSAIPSCADGSAMPSCADGSAMPSCADRNSIPSSAANNTMPSCTNEITVPSSNSFGDNTVSPCSADIVSITHTAHNTSMQCSPESIVLPGYCTRASSSDNISTPSSGDNITIPSNSESEVDSYDDVFGYHPVDNTTLPSCVANTDISSFSNTVVLNSASNINMSANFSVTTIPSSVDRSLDLGSATVNEIKIGAASPQLLSSLQTLISTEGLSNPDVGYTVASSHTTLGTYFPNFDMDSQAEIVETENALNHKVHSQEFVSNWAEPDSDNQFKNSGRSSDSKVLTEQENDCLLLPSKDSQVPMPLHETADTTGLQFELTDPQHHCLTVKSSTDMEGMVINNQVQNVSNQSKSSNHVSEETQSISDLVSYSSESHSLHNYKEYDDDGTVKSDKLDTYTNPEESTDTKERKLESLSISAEAKANQSRQKEKYLSSAHGSETKQGEHQETCDAPANSIHSQINPAVDNLQTKNSKTPYGTNQSQTFTLAAVENQERAPVPGSSNRHLSSVEANNPLVTQLLQGNLPLEKVLPQLRSGARLEINRLPLPSRGSAESRVTAAERDVAINIPNTLSQASKGHTWGTVWQIQCKTRDLQVSKRQAKSIGEQSQSRLKQAKQFTTVGVKMWAQTPLNMDQDQSAEQQTLFKQEWINKTFIQHKVNQGLEFKEHKRPLPACSFEQSLLTSNDNSDKGCNSQAISQRQPTHQKSVTLRGLAETEASLPATPPATLGYGTPNALTFKRHLEGSSPAFNSTAQVDTSADTDQGSTEAVFSNSLKQTDNSCRATQTVQNKFVKHLASLSEREAPPDQNRGSVTMETNKRMSSFPTTDSCSGIKMEQFSVDDGLNNSCAVDVKDISSDHFDSKEQVKVFGPTMDVFLGKIVNESDFSSHLPSESSKPASQLATQKLLQQQQLYRNYSTLHFSGTNLKRATTVIEQSIGSFLGSSGSSTITLSNQNTSIPAHKFSDNSGGEELELKCSCRLKAMIMCKGCGAFCHDDCIGPSKLCVACLVVR